LIVPSGLLLVLSHLLTVPVLLAGGVGKHLVTKTWDVRNNFCWWRYSYKSKLSSTPFKIKVVFYPKYYVQAIILPTCGDA
jgi:hypothetical protein